MRSRDSARWQQAVVTAVVLLGVGCAGQSTPRGRTAPTPSAAVQPAPPPLAQGLTGRVLFARAGGSFGDETLFTLNLASRETQRISGYGATCCARITHDGSRILEAATGPGDRITTAVSRNDGTRRHLLPLPPGTLQLGPGAWSPDGSHIAFEGWDDTDAARNGLYVALANGHDLRRVTHAPEPGHDLPMDFSPDGRRIAFLRPQPGTQDPTGPVYVVNTDGSQLHRVTPPGTDAAYSVRWSPGGEWLAFTEYWAVPDTPIMLVHPDGSGLHAVFHDAAHRSVVTPAWSPDGHSLLFGLAVATGQDHPADILCVVNEDGSHLRAVLTSNDFIRLPEWVQ